MRHFLPLVLIALSLVGCGMEPVESTYNVSADDSGVPDAEYKGIRLHLNGADEAKVRVAIDLAERTLVESGFAMPRGLDMHFARAWAVREGESIGVGIARVGRPGEEVIWLAQGGVDMVHELLHVALARLDPSRIGDANHTNWGPLGYWYLSHNYAESMVPVYR